MRIHRFGVAVCFVLAACGSEPEQVPATGGESTSGFARLLAGDPLRHSYDFVRDDYGALLQDGLIRNAGSHLDFDAYHAGEFTVGLQGDELGAIVDLGTDDDLALALGATQTAGGGQGFAALALRDGGFTVPEADVILATPDTWAPDLDHAPVERDHVYAARVVGAHGFELVVKLLVVEHDRERGVAAVEWARLR